MYRNLDSIVPSSVLEKRNCNVITYGNETSMTPESIKRSNTGGGKRQMQPRQNPLMSSSPRNSAKPHLTPSEKKYGGFNFY